jgi:uncharacterized membrane protein YfcA
MEIFLQILFFLVLGSIIGLVSGLLGIGGGTIAVPVMIFFLPLFNIPSSVAMQTAIATSLATVIFTTFASAKTHHLSQRIRWRIIKKVALSFIMGAITGSLLAQDISSIVLQRMFGVFEIILGFYFFWMKEHPSQIQHPLPHPFLMNIVGYGISTLSVLLGIGGGFLTIPALVYCRISLKEAIGTSTVLSFILATVGSLFFLFPDHQLNIHPYSLGYLYLPALLPMGVASFFLAQVGVKLIPKIPSVYLKKGFAILIMIGGIGMLMKDVS